MMPSSSSKQHNFMAAVANNPAFAKKAGVPQSVGKEFVNADKGKTFKQGGEMKESKGMMKKEVGFMKAKGAPKSMIKHEEAEMKGMKKGGKAMPTSMGSVRTAAPSRDGVASKGKTKGTMISMKKGGKAC
ncbi:MAG: hypothetical protein EB038_07615 [Cyclobacteriaceae bacterium]|jgi:hypothetical protein|nr:hypothetical protein [Cyclobacteriaceae bacterium]